MLLEGKKGLVLNVTNKNSIGWGIAQALADQGAEVGVGAQNERMLESVQKLVGDDDRFRAFQVDFDDEGQLTQLARDAAACFGAIDFLVHSAAFAPREDLAGRFIDTSRDGFGVALEVSCFSLIALCKHLEPIMNDDASIMALSYLGSSRAVPGYNVMGVAKAALEAAVRYLAVDLGQRGIRVNTLSPGPVNTVAARGVPGLLEKIDHVFKNSPLRRTFAQAEVGSSAVYLASDLSKAVTGQIIYIDSGYNFIAL
jgi:enoyl-[acyl-carrier protein] reductase I